MSKQPQIPHSPMIAPSCPSSSIAHDRCGLGRNRFLKWFSVAAVLFTSGHAFYAQAAADALFIDEKGNLTIGTTTFIYQSGNVGIGTMHPNSILDVRGRIYAQQLAFIDADGNWYPDNWIGMADNIEEKTPWLMIGGLTDKRKKENKETGSVDGDGKRRIALWADTTKVAGELIVQGAIEANALHVKQRLETIGRLQVDDNTETTYEVTDRYHLSLSSKYRGRTKTIPQDVLVALCGDQDGCQIRIGITQWGAKLPAAASQTLLFYYGKDNGHWRTEGGHTSESYDGNGTTEHVINVGNWNACFFTDAIYENGQDKSDKEKGMQLLWWTGGYNTDSRTCELTLID